MRVNEIDKLLADLRGKPKVRIERKIINGGIQYKILFREEYKVIVAHYKKKNRVLIQGEVNVLKIFVKMYFCDYVEVDFPVNFTLTDKGIIQDKKALDEIESKSVICKFYRI